MSSEYKQSSRWTVASNGNKSKNKVTKVNFYTEIHISDKTIILELKYKINTETKYAKSTNFIVNSSFGYNVFIEWIEQTVCLLFFLLSCFQYD